MRIVIVTNWNGIGLETDGRLLERLFVSWNHEVVRWQYDQAHSETYDLCVWLEVFNEHLVSVAPRHILFANPEWTRPESIRPIQRHVETVVAKTRTGEKSLREVFGNVVYTGFVCEDRWDETVPRTDRCLHIGGNSGHRGTNEVLAAWREYRYYDDRPLPELVCITNSQMVSCEGIPGVTFHKRVSNEELLELQNSCRFHVFPAQYEGWGQALHEAQAVGAILLTTDAGPMKEVGAPFVVPSYGAKRYNLGELHVIEPKDIRLRVPEMLAQPNYEIARLSMEARSRFERDNKRAAEAIRRLVERPARVEAGSGTPSGQKPRIALLGNFRPPHSTENDLLWTLRDMGYPVTPFQEDEDRTETILKTCVETSVVLLIYIHTHGWDTPGKLTLDDLWNELRSHGTRTASFHLDRYFGLNLLDHREERIGIHPFWRTDGVFTADGGNSEGFAARGVTHYWLPPGVVKRDTVPGEYRKDLAVDVGFVGAEGYHPEYPFRGELITFLRSVYGERFRLFQGYRGQDLNDLYASVRVCVGDSCFGGTDYYWSDRVPETLGRGGFLIHPASRGLDIPGLATYRPGDLHELHDRIDWFLEHEEARLACQKAAWQWVREHDTYHNRMAKLLQVMECV